MDRIARVTLQPSARRLSIDGRPLDLTSVEYEILARLVQHGGAVIARDRLIAEVFERPPMPDDRALDVHISHLRKKLGPHASLIVTVRGVGHMLRVALLAACLLLPVAAAAQEDIEPRIVGGRGVNTIGIAGFVDATSSSEESFPARVTLHVDAGRFLTSRIAVRGGLIGSTSIDADQDEDEIVTGPGAAALHAVAGAFYYFTPQSLLSFYSGAEYRAQLTRRADRDTGTLLGVAGLEATVSSRALLFIQAGYGARLTRGDEGELQRRLAGEIGIRIKF